MYEDKDAMSKSWITKDGKVIELSKLEDSHLLNILKYIERTAKRLDGEVIMGGGHDPDDMWYEAGDEEDWKIKFDYYELENEAIKRGLIETPVRKRKE
jgi:hypothetical protein